MAAEKNDDAVPAVDEAPIWSAQMAEVSARLDRSIVAEGPMHLLRIRCSKVAEELGEVEEQLIAIEGSNPRKAKAESDERLVEELLDVAAAALGAVEHLTGNVGRSARLLDQHCEHLVTRMRRVQA